MIDIGSMVVDGILGYWPTGSGLGNESNRLSRPLGLYSPSRVRLFFSLVSFQVLCPAHHGRPGQNEAKEAAGRGAHIDMTRIHQSRRPRAGSGREHDLGRGFGPWSSFGRLPWMVMTIQASKECPGFPRPHLRSSRSASATGDADRQRYNFKRCDPIVGADLVAPSPTTTHPAPQRQITASQTSKWTYGRQKWATTKSGSRYRSRPSFVYLIHTPSLGPWAGAHSDLAVYRMAGSPFGRVLWSPAKTPGRKGPTST
jgi:hypothetical protein